MRNSTALLCSIGILPSLAAAPEPTYAGSKACAACHASIYSTYNQTGMGRSAGPANLPSLLETLAEPVTIHNAKLDRSFQVFRNGLQLYQKEYSSEFESAYRLDYAVGSGENGQTFLVRRGDALVEAPLTFYNKPRKWDLSPGFESVDLGFHRPIEDACLSCHTARIQPVEAIGCENCHGPGSLHVTRHAPIVNPAKLPARLAADICMNCHQGGDTRILQPGRHYGDFRPGEPLSKTVAIFKAAKPPADSDLLDHHAAIELSQCFRASGGKLSCLTCHDPHRTPSSPASYFRERCLTCHTLSSCKSPTPAGDCIACHMPKRAVAQVSHAALTNHRIPRTPGQPLPAGLLPKPSAALPGIVYLNGDAATLPLLTKLAAYGELMQQTPELQSTYLKTLDQAAVQFPKHPLVLAALGRQALWNRRPEAALEYLSQAALLQPVASSTLLDLAQAFKALNRTAAGVPVLERAVSIDPLNPTVRKTLILAYIELKRYPEARAGMQEYVAAFPEDSLMRGLLRKVDPSGSSR